MQGRVLLENIDQNREKWLELRKGKISSSNIPTVAGLSPFKSRLELWAEYTGKNREFFSRQ